MESETPLSSVVNDYDEKSGDLSEVNSPKRFPDKIPTVECETLCRRIDGYVRGILRNGLFWCEAKEAKRKFVKRTGYSVSHINDIFPVWQKWTANFRIKRVRDGRSTMVHIYPIRHGLHLTTAEVRRRLIGAIRSYLQKSHRTHVHVDRRFLERFHELHRVDAMQIFYAWRTLTRIEGMTCNWRGRGNGKNFYVQVPRNCKAGKVSHQENSGRISPPTGGNEYKQGSATPPESKADRADACGVTPAGFVGDHRPITTDGRDVSEPSGGPESRETSPKPPGMDRASHRWRAASEPLHVGGRWIAGSAFDAKANFLTGGPIQAMHAKFFRVRFRWVHAWNFCVRALRGGFLDSEIVAAYEVGAVEAHASGTRDWERAGLTGEWAPREPSQIVARAELRLAADPRSIAERWTAFFAGTAAPQKAFAIDRAAVREVERREAGRGGEGADQNPCTSNAPKKETNTAAKETNMRGDRTTPVPAREASDFISMGPGLRVRAPAPDSARLDPAAEWEAKKKSAAKLPDPAPAMLRLNFTAPKTFEAHLKARGLTLEQLLKLPRAEQQKFVREAIAAQKGGGECS